MSEKQCTYPDCKCPFDMGADNRCSKGLPRMSRNNQLYEKQYLEQLKKLASEEIDATSEIKVDGVDVTLNERGERYGDFKSHAAITQSIKRAMQNTPRWSDLSDDKKEALEMVAHKIGRILNGDPEYHDSWHDIIGYTRLVEKDLSK